MKKTGNPHKMLLTEWGIYWALGIRRIKNCPRIQPIEIFHGIWLWQIRTTVVYKMCDIVWSSLKTPESRRFIFLFNILKNVCNMLDFCNLRNIYPLRIKKETKQTLKMVCPWRYAFVGPAWPLNSASLKSLGTRSEYKSRCIKHTAFHFHS